MKKKATHRKKKVRKVQRKTKQNAFQKLQPAHKLLAGLGLIIIIFLAIYLSQRSNTVVSVNGVAITTNEIDKRFDQVPEQYKEFVTRDVIIQQSINEELLLQEATTKGIIVTDEEVEQFINLTITSSGLSQEAFEERVEEQGLSVKDLNELYRRQLMINRLIEEEVIASIEIAEADVLATFRENSSVFNQGDQVTASHILITTEGRSSEEAKEIINAIYAEATPENFADLAKEKSEGPSGPNGGDLGTFGKGAMVAPFEEVAFSTAAGDISEPVETQFGWHIIYVRDVIKGKKANFDDVKDSIRANLEQQAQQQAVVDYLETLQANANIIHFE